MLVLSRKMDESIVIGDNVVVRVLGIRGKHVRLGIEGPRSVSIVRAELQFEDPTTEDFESFEDCESRRSKAPFAYSG